MSIDIVQMSFDYSALDEPTRAFVQEKERSIQSRMKRMSDDAIAIGQDLIAVKGKLEDGKFTLWLKSCFDLSMRTAERYMQYAERFGESPVAKLSAPSSVLAELLNSDETIIEQVESGQIPATLPAIREAKQAIAPDVSPRFPENWGKADLPYAEPTYPDYVHPLERGLYDAFSEVVAREQIAATPRGVPAALQSSESNEWYTPREYVDAARELMRGIDIDPASCDFANKVVQAKNFYVKGGIYQSWKGRVWLNPPYGFSDGMSNQELWSRTLIERYRAGLVDEAVLLVNANTEAKWFQPLYDYLICLTNHRIRFYNTSGDSSQPTQGNALVYFGKQRKRFIELFSKFGTVIERAKVDEC